MPERGGPTTQSGILYQNTVAALYLGRLLDPLPRRAADRVVEVRVEAPTDVDDTVVTFADRHRTYVQSKENVRKASGEWDTLWGHVAAQFRRAEFRTGADRLLLHVGEIQDEHHALRELCGRARTSRDYAEWWARMTQEQHTLVGTIKPLLDQAAPDDGALLAFFQHVDVDIAPLTELERSRAPFWMPANDHPPDTLLRLLRDRVGGAGRSRDTFAADPLRRALEADNGVCLATAPSIDALRVAARSCGSLLRQHKATIGATGRHIPRGVVGNIASWATEIPDTARVGMLLDGTGAGKTVALRDVLDALESQGVTVLAIKADQQLSGIGSYDELPARLHLPDSVERVVAGLSLTGPVVVLIDQIDALSLSLAHDQVALNVALDLVARLRTTTTTTILLSCRAFDRNSDPRLKRVAVEREFSLPQLEEGIVRDVLGSLDIDYDALPPAARQLLRVPLHLDLFALLPWGGATARVTAGGITSLQTLYALLWRDVVLRPDPDGPPAAERVEALRLLTDDMDRHQRTSAPQSLLAAPGAAHLARAVGWLASAGIIVPGATEWTFLHQTFFDYCYARRFVERGGRLAETVLQGDQGLFARPQLIQVLAYLRGQDPRVYLGELNALLISGRLRAHLCDLLLRWFGALPDPTDAEWQLARRLLVNPATRAQVLLALRGNAAWFARIQGATLPMLLAQDDATLDTQVIPYLASLLDVAQVDVIAAVRPHLERSERWTNRVARLLSQIQAWQTPEAIGLLAHTLRALPSLQPTLIYPLDDIADIMPQAACRLIRQVLDRVLDRHLEKRAATGAPTYSPVGGALDDLGGSTIDRAFARAGQAEPGLFVEAMVPWLERALGATVAEPASYASDDLSHGWHAGVYHVQRQLIAALVAALIALARTEPDAFRRAVGGLAALPFKTPQHLVALAYQDQDVAARYVDDALEFMLADPRRLDLGEYEQYDTRRLIAAIYPHLIGDRRAALEGYILTHTRRLAAWGLEGLREQGRDTLYLLQAIPGGPTTDQASRRLRELERKFPGVRAAEHRITSGSGYLGSPIGDRAVARMSDDAWLGAMDAYRGRARHRHVFRGGARQLAIPLATRVKEEPERFYHLALRAPEDTDAAYIEALVTGLADAAAPSSRVFAIVRRFSKRDDRGLRATMARALEKRAADGLPDDLIDTLDRYVRDPAEDAWEESTDPDSAYLNSDRGAAFHALMRALDARGTADAGRRTWAAIAYAATNGSTALRAGAMEWLLYMLHGDRDGAIALFERLMEGRPTLRRSHNTREFLYYGMYQRFGRMKPYIRALMEEADEKAQQNGAELACVAALSGAMMGTPEEQAAARELARAAATGRVAWRRSAARIYAHNLASDTSDACEQALRALLDDDDTRVRRSIGDVFTVLREDHAVTLHAFIAAYVASRSLVEGRRRVAEYLLEHGMLDPSGSLAIVETILNNAPPPDDTEPFAGGEELIRLVLRVYTDPTADDALGTRAMDLFDRLTELHGAIARTVLDEWDRR